MDFPNSRVTVNQFQQQVQSPPEPPRRDLLSRAWVKALLLVVVLAGFAGSFQYGLAQGRKGLVFQPKEFKVVNQQDQPKIVDYNLLWEALGVLDQKFIDKPLDPEKELIGAVKGAVASTGDPYTQYFDKDDLAEFKTELKGSFFGIGAEVGKKGENIVIVAPLDDSPAQKAGVLPGDLILNVNGESTAGWAIEEAVNKIRGEKGSVVTLTLYREGKPKPFDVQITRDEIKIKSVKSEIKEVNGKKIAVIKLSRFGDDTVGLFRVAAQEAQNAHVSGVVLDLRSDPGGYLQAAVEVASHWLSKDTLVVTEAHSTGENVKYTSFGYGTLQGIPTLVLINGGSASASEIVAGALRDNNAAKLLGEKSFGKGSVQELVDLKGGGAVKVTVAKWITPGGKNLNKNGLEPDIGVKLTEEDINNKKDPQMDKALEEIVK